MNSISTILFALLLIHFAFANEDQLETNAGNAANAKIEAAREQDTEAKDNAQKKEGGEVPIPGGIPTRSRRQAELGMRRMWINDI